MWKIIQIDNYDREYRADVLVADNIQSEELGKVMLEALQQFPQRPTDDWYRLVEASHALWRGMKELI